jgi:hypothetical protein
VTDAHGNHRELPDCDRLPEAKVRKVLERAIQIDAERSTETSIAELRRVAEELNISPTALEQALHEVNAPTAAPTDALPKTKSWWTRAGRRFARTLCIAGAGELAGMIAGGPQSFVVMVGLLVAGSLQLTKSDFYATPKRSPLFDIIILFNAFAFGHRVLHKTSVDAEPGKLIVLTAGALIAFAGALILPKLMPPTPFGAPPRQEFSAST